MYGYPCLSGVPNVVCGLLQQAGGAHRRHREIVALGMNINLVSSDTFQ